MDVYNIGDILHVIILMLILVWLFYHQWLFIKLWAFMRQLDDKLQDNKKEADKNNNRRDCDFQLKP